MYSDNILSSFRKEDGNFWARDTIPNLERDGIKARTAKVQAKCTRDGVKPHAPIAPRNPPQAAAAERDDVLEDFRKQAEEGEGEEGV